MHRHPGGIVDAAFCLHAAQWPRGGGGGAQDGEDILVEGRKAGAVDFYIGGDFNIELRLGIADEDLHGLDSIEWCGMYGPECEGGGEDVISFEMRCLQLLKEFNCTVTSTWTNDDGNRECHSWRAWGSRVCLEAT